MNPLPVQRASQLASTGPQTQWLVEGLWSEQAVGILGGEPKCCKSFLALDVAVSVASGAACLRQFPVRRSGPVLLFPAEDSLAVVRQRLEGIAAAAQVPFASLPVEVITAPSLRLDTPTDRSRLSHTVQQLRPILLILDPLIRLHRVDENDASQIAGLLSYLRELQRQFQLAVLLVHHARKDSHSSRPGQALRGSSELHGWGDSNLYMRRKGSQLTLSTEHRAAPGQDHIPLQLTQSGPALALTVLERSVIEPATPTNAGGSGASNPGSTPGTGAAEPPAQTLRHAHRRRLLRFDRTIRQGRSRAGRQRLSTQTAVSRFPPYRPPRKRKRETR